MNRPVTRISIIVLACMVVFVVNVHAYSATLSKPVSPSGKAERADDLEAPAPPAPSITQSEPSEALPTEADPTRQPDKSGTIESSGTVKIQKAPDGAELALPEGAEHSEKILLDWLTLAGILMTAIFTGCLANATNKLWFSTNKLWQSGEQQLKLTKESIDLANREFVHTYRPKIIVRQVYFSEPSLIVDQPIEVDYIIAIVGETRAIVIEIGLAIEIEAMLPPIPRMASEVISNHAIAPGSPWHRHYKSPTILSEALNQDVQARRKNVFLIGYVKYLDDNGIIRFMGACRKFDFSAHRFKKYPDEDYEYSD